MILDRCRRNRASLPWFSGVVAIAAVVVFGCTQQGSSADPNPSVQAVFELLDRVHDSAAAVNGFLREHGGVVVRVTEDAVSWYLGIPESEESAIPVKDPGGTGSTKPVAREEK